MWIESHSNLARHPKTRRLMKLLGWSLPDTIGNLHLLWWWAQDFAPTGDLSCFSAEDLTADLDLCGATPEQFVEAMVATGFLDRIEHTLCIHDWVDYTTRSRRSPRSTPPALSPRPGTPGHDSNPVVPPRRDISNDELSTPDPAIHNGSTATAHSSESSAASERVEPATVDVPHLLSTQPGFTNVWWPKFLEMYADKGCPLTSYEQREFLKRLLEKPHSAVPMLKTSVESYRSNLQGSSARPSRLAIAGAGTKREEHLENTS